MNRTVLRQIVLVSSFALTSLMPSIVSAQNYGSTGTGWSANWGFSSSNDRSLGLATAQAIRTARTAPLAPVYNTYNETTYDNRGNYQEYNLTDSATVAGGAFHIGDQIGQNTNSIGSMNTGTTNIDVQGSGNSIVATNGADNTGCVDGSIGLNSIDPMTATSTMGIDISINGLGAASTCR